MGKKVKDLVQDRYLETGEHSYAWDGRNEQGKQVGSGTYFVRLRAGTEHKGLKLTYMKAARGIVSTGTDEIIAKIEKNDAISRSEIEFSDLSPEEKERLLGKSNPSYENVKKLAEGIATSFTQVETALSEAITYSGAENRYKVNLATFVVDSPISDVLCKTMGISKSELQKIAADIFPTPYIYVPKSYRKWNEEELPVIAVTPPCDDDSVEAIIAYNTGGEEVIIGKSEIPEFPVVVITAEPPFEAPSLKGGRNDVVHDAMVDTFRFWGVHDPPWNEEPEFYTKCYIEDGSYNPDPAGPQTAWFQEVDECCDEDTLVNCDCDGIPDPGDYGYTPNRRVGQTKQDYPYFKLLKLYDKDDWWEGGGDDHIDDFTFNHKQRIDERWYVGTEGTCDHADLFMHGIGVAK